MPLQLTPEQEQSIKAIVGTGAYSSAEEALNAAVVAVERAADVNFEGTHEELEILLTDGLASPEVPANQFWSSVDRETNALHAAHKPEPHA